VLLPRGPVLLHLEMRYMRLLCDPPFPSSVVSGPPGPSWLLPSKFRWGKPLNIFHAKISLSSRRGDRNASRTGIDVSARRRSLFKTETSLKHENPLSSTRKSSLFNTETSLFNTKTLSFQHEDSHSSTQRFALFNTKTLSVMYLSH